MTTQKSTRPLPPGDRGWPIVGATLDFLRDPFGFIDRGLEKHGPIFRTHILGHDTVIIAGALEADAFIREELCLREGGTPKHIQELLGGRTLAGIDRLEHRVRKKQILAAFTPDVLLTYVPALQQLVERTFTRWQGQGEFAAIEALQRLALEAICKTVLSLDPGPRLDAIFADFKTLLVGIGGVPISLPGTKYTDAVHAGERIIQAMRDIVAEHGTGTWNDGLSRILTSRAEDGSTIAPEDAARELHHVLIAGYVVFAELAWMVVQLHKSPALHERIRAEVHNHSGSGAIQVRSFGAMPELDAFIKEVKRVVPIVPAVFAKADREFDLGGYHIPQGWAVWWSVRGSLHDARTFQDPQRFDPTRFSERKEDLKHPNGFAPHGAGPAMGHKCPGTDFATLMMQIFATVMLRDHQIDVPVQRLELDWTKVPPEPADGLRIRVVKAAAVTPKLSADVFVALAAVAWADGNVSSVESTTLLEAARMSGLDDAARARVEGALRAKTGYEELTRLALSRDEREYVFTLAAWIARADGVVSPGEVQVLDHFARHLDLDSGQRERAELAASALQAAMGAGDFARLSRALIS